MTERSVAPSGLMVVVSPYQGFRASHFTPACGLPPLRGLLWEPLLSGILALLRYASVSFVAERRFAPPLPVICQPFGLCFCLGLIITLPPLQGTDGAAREKRSLLRLFRVATEEGEANWRGWVCSVGLFRSESKSLLSPYSHFTLTRWRADE